MLTNKTAEPNKLAYPLEEAGSLIGVSKSKLRKDIKAGLLKARLIGTKVVILRADLDQYLDNEAKEWVPKSDRISVAVA